MKSTLKQFFQAARQDFANLEAECDSCPPDWQRAIQAATEAGAYLDFRFGFGHAGLVASSLMLVAPDGELIPLASSEPGHA